MEDLEADIIINSNKAADSEVSVDLEDSTEARNMVVVVGVLEDTMEGEGEDLVEALVVLEGIMVEEGEDLVVTMKEGITEVEVAPEDLEDGRVSFVVVKIPSYV